MVKDTRQEKAKRHEGEAVHAITAARRLAAILAADVVGYSRLMGEDEAGTAKIVRERREAAAPIVRSFGGRLVKTMGDGVLLEFPSIVAAVECAVAIQKMMAECNASLPEAKRILYRIGVNLGDVLVEGDDILGDGVNVAARLEGICEPGGVLWPVQPTNMSAAGSRPSSSKSASRASRTSPARARLCAVAGGDRFRQDRGARDHRRARKSAARADRREPPRLSLVVLPFANIGGDPEQEYFVDGVTESLTTDLSRISGAFVIGRSTAFTYKGKAVDLKQVGRELNVRYVLEGSVQRGGNRMRVNVQLIEAESGRAPVGRALRQAGRRPLRHAGRDRRSARRPTQGRADRRRGATGGERAQSRFDGPLFSGARH